MDIQINKEEMRLMGFLHEHAGGSGPRFAIPANQVTQGLGISKDDLKKQTSFVVEHGLVGIQVFEINNSITHSFDIINVCLTGPGENMMRTLDEKLSDQIPAEDTDQTPGTAKKLTLKAVDVVYDISKAVIAAVAANYVTGKH